MSSRQPFTASEVASLQRLIADTPPNDLIKDEQLKDADILFFSQYGHLEGTADDDTNFQMLQGIDVSTNDDTSFPLTPQEVSPNLTNSKSDLPEPVQNGIVPTKKGPFLNFTQAKYKEIDGKSTRIFECVICGKEFGHQYTLMRHIPTHTDERKFHCLTCGKSFRQMSTLSQHRAIHSSERPYVCEVCNKDFNRVSTLISHRKTHTGVKPHRCHMCNKAFHQKGNLRNHIFTHTNERPYKCDICEKGFNQMSNLMCHKLKAHQHQGDVIPRYRCKVCGEEFLKRIYLRQHEQFKHGMMDHSSDSSGVKEYYNAIMVDPITTDAMKMAMLSGDTPFALLRPLSGIPVLVRVIPAGDKQMLVPATAEDLKKYGHISIRPKVAEAKANEAENKENQSQQKGCVVQIKVPVVATVIQKSGGLNGSVSMNVIGPSPGDILDQRGGNMADLNTDSFVYTSTLTDDVLSGMEKSSTVANLIDSFPFDDKYDQMIGNGADGEIEFVDQCGNVVNANEFQKNLDINSMPLHFDVRRNDIGGGEVTIFNGSSLNEQEKHASDIPEGILVEQNGQYIEL